MPITVDYISHTHSLQATVDYTPATHNSMQQVATPARHRLLTSFATQLKAIVG